ncbi:MAG: hypothetical protein V1820_01570 [archaeon]
MLEIRRQAVHLILFSICAFPVIYFPLNVSIAIFSLLLSVSLSGGLILKYDLERFLPKKLRIVEVLSRKAERKEDAGKLPFYGSTIGLVGILAALLISGSKAFIPILILAWGDSTSTVVGIHLGKTNLFSGRSLEGSVGFFFAALIPLFISTSLSDGKIVLIALAATLTEIFSPVNDNLSIPIVTSLLLRLLA